MYTKIGQIINTHGIEGAVKVYPYTHEISRFSLLDAVFVGENKVVYHIKDARYIKNMAILFLNGVDSIEKALSLKNKFIYIKDEERLPLAENHYYISDLLGLDVYDEQGVFQGKICEVYEGYANDVYYVENDGKKFGVPAVKDFIKEIDLTKRVMVVHVIEGMKE